MSSTAFRGVEAGTARYDLGDVLPFEGADAVDPGTSILVSGPSMLGKREVALDLLAAGGRAEPMVVVTPDRGSRRVLRAYRARDDAPENLYLVDCSGVGDGDPFGDTEREYSLSGPDDLTRIGIALVKSTRAMGSAAENGVRVGLLSLSTVLQYAGVDRTFDFLHVVTNRFAATGYLGVATLDPTVHEPRIASAILTLFDAAVDLREGDDGGRELRVRGLSGVPREWRRF